MTSIAQPSLPQTQPQEATYTESATFLALGDNSFRVSWTRARRLIECQLPPGLVLEKVLVGPTLFPGNTWEGQRVSAGEVVTACVHNTANDFKKGAAVWFTEDVVQIPEDLTAKDHVVPANPPNHDQAAPPNMPETVSTTVHESAPMPAPQVAPLQPGGPVQQGQLAIPQPGPPPVNMQPGMQYVQHVSGPTMTNAAGTGPGVQGHVQGQIPSYVQVHAPPGQQIFHTGGSNIPTHSSSAPVTAGPDEIVALMSRERCNKVVFAMRGGIIGQHESPSILNPLENAMLAAPGMTLTPGMNEVAIRLTRKQAERVIGQVRGSHYLEEMGIINVFEAAAKS